LSPAIAAIIAPPGQEGVYPARLGIGLPSKRFQGQRRPAESAGGVGIDVALEAGMRTKHPFDLWSTEQVLLVYERHFGKLDPKARRRILEDARLNGWDRTWGDGIELLAA
jgi:hypothetical protein